MDDLNSFLRRDEKIGYPGVSVEPCTSLRHFVDTLGLEDLPNSGHHLTWYNNQDERSRIRAKLDRAMSNRCWFDMFEGSSAFFLPSGLPDHSPAVVEWRQQNRSPQSFSFFESVDFISTFYPFNS